MNEFELIERYFRRDNQPAWLKLGIGDDAALMQPSAGQQLAICSDTLIAGRHFPIETAAQAIGWKALAVNLSDLAAMGARPLGFLLNLSLPAFDEEFLSGFSQGLFSLADRHQVALIGGDTTRGDLSISITAFGEVAAGDALARGHARPGDLILQVGDIGGAALALKQGRDASAGLRQRLDQPRPFLTAGAAMAGLASACIDVSDGFAADLNHMLQRSGVGAQIRLDQLKLHPDLRELAHEQALKLALHGGDDYALLACISQCNWDRLRAQTHCADLRAASVVGQIVAGSGIMGLDADGRHQVIPAKGYSHF